MFSYTYRNGKWQSDADDDLIRPRTIVVVAAILAVLFVAFNVFAFFSIRHTLAIMGPAEPPRPIPPHVIHTCVAIGVILCLGFLCCLGRRVMLIAAVHVGSVWAFLLWLGSRGWSIWLLGVVLGWMVFMVLIDRGPWRWEDEGQ